MSTQVISTRYEILETAPGTESPPFVVSKARDKEEGRVVALQVLPASALGAAPGERQSVLGEFQAAVREAMRLDHAGILRVYDQGASEAGGDPYVVREYMRGITLQERIRRIAPFTLAVAVDIGAAVGEALVAAHRLGVPHGDLRPSRVLLSPEGQIKVGDFSYGGVASYGAGGGTDDATLAPELRPGETSFVGDVYALGAMLYEMLTGVPLFDDGARTTSPRELNPGVPPALDGLVQKALHTDLGVRYRSASNLLADLQAVRDALRTGKSLTWSPLTSGRSEDKRAPRPSAAVAPVEATAVAPRPVATEPAAATPTPPAAPPAPEGDGGHGGRRQKEPREGTSALGKIFTLVFIIFVLGIIGLTWYATKFMEPPSDVMVPNLVGKTFDDAKRIAQQDHFTLVESPDSGYSDTMPENQIYQQNPLPGHSIKEDKEVTVFRSLGPRLLTVPGLVGTTQDYANSALQDASLPLGNVTSEYSDTVPVGVVIRQSPDRGSRVARNTAVNFAVSKGRQPPDTPADIQADATGPDKVDLSWQAAPRAESYTVQRSLNGDETTVARGLTDTHFSDTGLQPETTYSYTVSAVNAAGTSDPSESDLVTTEAKVDSPPVLSPDTTVVPAPGDDGTIPPPVSSGGQTPRLRQFTIEFHVPRRPRHTRHVQIEVQDTTGTNLVHDENYEPGSDVSAPVQGIGNKVTFRIFLDTKLVKQQTF